MTNRPKWYQEHRLAWIAETLHVFGFINKRHLIRKFGISLGQASNDFREFNKRYPLAMTYVPHQKRYVANDKGQGFIFCQTPVWFGLDMGVAK